MRRSTATAEIAPHVEYDEITVRLWGKGVVRRGSVMGATIAGSRRFIARRGQFIVSRIDARNGALGIVPPELDGALVTNDFPLFDLDRARIEPGFLEWLSKTNDFVTLCQQASEGTTNRVRLKEEKFLTLEIGLPPLDGQQRIVARIEELATKVEETKQNREEARRISDTFVTGLHMQLAGNRSRMLGELLNLDEDVVPIEPAGEYPQIGIRSFGGGLFAKPAVRGVDTAYKTFNRLYDGAIVLSQVKGWEGAVAVCGNDLAGWYASPEYRTFRCKPDEARPGYLAALVRTGWFHGLLQQATRGVGARRERTRPEQFIEIEIPMPSPQLQERAEIAFRQLETVGRLRLESTAALDSLLPSILDYAFNGKL
jgi:type I restriction enzyme S subunit